MFFSAMGEKICYPVIVPVEGKEKLFRKKITRLHFCMDIFYLITLSFCMVQYWYYTVSPGSILAISRLPQTQNNYCKKYVLYCSYL